MHKRRELRYARWDMGPLADNKKHCFSRDFTMNLYRHAAVFSFIPKNACTMMRFSIAVDNGFLSADDDVNWIHANNRTFNSSQSELATAKFTFTILRCPFDRLASTYLDKIVGMYRDAWDFRADGSKLGSASQASFTDFVTEITSGERIRRNQHWRPQMDFMIYSDYDRFYSFAKMPEMIKELKETMAFEAIDVRKAAAHDRSRLQIVEGDFSTTPAFEIAAMKRSGTCPSTEALYNEQTLKLVEHHYRDDIRLYTLKTGMPLTVSL
jgi:hypothetical protein